MGLVALACRQRSNESDEPKRYLIDSRSPFYEPWRLFWNFVVVCSFVYFG